MKILFTIIRAWEQTRTVAANNELMSVIVNEFILKIDDKFVLSFIYWLFISNNDEEV